MKGGVSIYLIGTLCLELGTILIALCCIGIGGFLLLLCAMISWAQRGTIQFIYEWATRSVVVSAIAGIAGVFLLLVGILLALFQ
jgi:hypothetical protein